MISWIASQSAAPGGGLAVLLDGPQGVDWSGDRLGVSLLRGPTWPDPSADRGWHRQRFALMPLSGNWMAAGVPQASLAMREPGWLAPMDSEKRQWLPAVPKGLLPIALQPIDGRCRLRLLNPGASRITWNPGHPWMIVRQDDAGAREAVRVGPGELVELELSQSS